MKARIIKNGFMYHLCNEPYHQKSASYKGKKQLLWEMYLGIFPSTSNK